MTLTKAILAARVAEKRDGPTLKGAAEAVEHTFEIIKAALEGGENVLISGFGKFTVRDKHVRVGRNPRTGTPLTIAARRVVAFKPSQGLRAAVRTRGR